MPAPEPAVVPNVTPVPRPKGRPKGSKKGIPEKLPKPLPIEVPPPPPLERQESTYHRMTSAELHEVLAQFHRENQQRQRDQRMELYRSWLNT